MKAPLLPNRYENPSLLSHAIALSMIQDEVPSEAEDKMLMTPTPAPATRTVRSRPFMISWPSRASWLTASLAPPTTAPTNAMTRSHHHVKSRRTVMTPPGAESRAGTSILTQNVVTNLSIWM